MLTVAWDVDDVLNELTRSWLAWWGATRVALGRPAFAELRENPPHRLVGISRDAYLASLDEFRSSQAGMALTPDARVLDWFHTWGEQCRHIVITATPLANAAPSAAWVMRHFGTWVRSFNLVPSPRECVSAPEYDKSKAEFLEWFGRADVLIDDSPANVAGARVLGIETVLVPQPWNNAHGTLADALQSLTRLVDQPSRKGS